jgi:hypothetical protein
MKWIRAYRELQSKLVLENKKRTRLNWLWVLSVVEVCDYVDERNKLFLRICETTKHHRI